MSVAIATYNHRRFIRQALDTVLMQKTDFPFEVIVGDDCSTDGTREIVEEYARAHPEQIVPVLPERNLGDGGRPMFMAAFEHCRGDYIASSEGDDFWTCDRKLQRQADFLDGHPQCSLCFHDAMVVAEDGALVDEHFVGPRHPRFISTEHVVRWFCIPSCSPVIRRAVLAHLPKWFFIGPFGDLPFYLAAAEAGLLGYIDERMAAYRVHSGGAWSGMSDSAKGRAYIDALSALERPLGPKYAPALAQTKSFQHIGIARMLARKGQWLAASRQVGAALALDPLLRISLRVAVRSVLWPVARRQRKPRSRS
jgi:hypothetical protein